MMKLVLSSKFVLRFLSLFDYLYKKALSKIVFESDDAMIKGDLDGLRG